MNAELATSVENEDEEMNQVAEENPKGANQVNSTEERHPLKVRKIEKNPANGQDNFSASAAGTEVR